MLQFDSEHLPEVCVKGLDVNRVILDCTPSDLGLPYSNEDGGEHDTAPLITCCAELGEAYHARNLYLGSFDDASLHLIYSTLALAFSPSSREARAHALRNVGLAFVARYKKDGSKADIGAAADAHRHALRLATGCVSDVDIFLLDLAVALRERHDVFGSSEDLTEAIERLQNILTRPGSSHAAATIEFAKCLGRRYIVLKDLDDLQTALTLAHQSHVLQSPRHPRRHEPLVVMGVALMDIFENTGNAQHLHEAVTCLKEAAQHCAGGHPLQIHALPLLSYVWMLRSNLAKDKEVLDKVALAAQRCLEVRPNSGVGLAALAKSLATRYEWCGSPDDVDATIRLFKAQLAIMTPGKYRFVASLNGKAIRHHANKADHSLDSGYLDESITLLRQAHTMLLAANHVSHVITMFNLTHSLVERFIRHQSQEDLREAIQLHNSWLLDGQETAPPLQWFYLANIASTRHIRFELSKLLSTNSDKHRESEMHDSRLRFPFASM